MNHLTGLLRGGGLLVFASALSFSAEPTAREKNIELVRTIFRRIEQRTPEAAGDQFRLFQPDIEMCWPPSLPYGGTTRGVKREGPTWGSTWAPLQPTAAERSMSPRIVAATDDEVVVLWRQRGVSPHGQRFDGEVLGLYQIRDGKLARAQMLYFDPTAAAEFLAKAKAESAAPKP